MAYVQIFRRYPDMMEPDLCGSILDLICGQGVQNRESMVLI